MRNIKDLIQIFLDRFFCVVALMFALVVPEKALKVLVRGSSKKEPPRPQDAFYLFQIGHGVMEEHQHFHQCHNVEARVRKRERIGVRELNIIEALGLAQINHPLADIDTVNVAPLFILQEFEKLSGIASDIQHL